MAAAEVFEKDGFAAATMDQIAHRANATKGAVYFHFPSKAALAAAVVTRQHDVWAGVAEALEVSKLNGLDLIETAIREVSQTYAMNPLMRAGVRLASESNQIEVDLDEPFLAWIQRLTALLRRGQRDGSVRSNLNCAAAARVLVASFYGVEEVSSRLHDRADLNRRVIEWWQLIRPGLAPTVTSPSVV